MRNVDVVVRNETGLHSRPADLFVRTARLYESVITIRKDDAKADAKNIIKVILLNVSRDQKITIEADGPDEERAAEDLKTLVESGFSEINKKVVVENGVQNS